MMTTPSHTVSRSGARSMAQVSLFAALMAVMGLIPKIDLPLGVPITIQSLGVMLAGVMLGPWRGLQSMALFLAAVAVGLPLLSGGRGGIGVFMAPSAGYLIGYMLAAAVTGAIMAACISAGMSTDQLRTFYRNSGRQMFDKASLFKRLHYSYNKEPLARKL